MVQDGIEDYGHAKRKAAKQLGLPDSQQLPTNDEIDTAVREYQCIYRRDDQPPRVRALREHAVRVMRRLARFNPHLTGSVLSGTAGPYAGIQLQLFADSSKVVGLYLLVQGIAFEATQSRCYVGNESRIVPVYTLYDDGAEVTLSVFEVRDLRAPLRATAQGRLIERARLNDVERLLGRSVD